MFVRGGEKRSGGRKVGGVTEMAEGGKKIRSRESSVEDVGNQTILELNSHSFVCAFHQEPRWKVRG